MGASTFSVEAGGHTDTVRFRILQVPHSFTPDELFPYRDGATETQQ